MKTHCTEQQLIDYAFELTDDAGQRQTQAHLDTCAVCRRRLEELKGRFAALDLLRDEITVSDDLASRTVVAATAPRQPRILALHRHGWLGAVAAVLVVAVALLVTSPFEFSPAPTGQTETEHAVEERVPKAGTFSAEPKRQGKVADALTAPVLGRHTATNRPARNVPTPMRETLTAAAPMLDEAIDETPPFAPASAIELVVLPRRENVQLTIYNSADLTLVREQRNLTLKKGWNWLQFMWSGTLIDPTSLSLEPLARREQVEVQQLVFPPRLRELGRWLIRSEFSGQVPFELTYLTSGLSWRAFYMGTLSEDETTMDLESYVRVDNHSGEDYEDAQTRLIVGQVHLLDQVRELAQRRYPYGCPEGFGVRPASPDGYGYATNADEESSELLAKLGVVQEKLDSWSAGRGPKEVVKEGLSEYFLYTIEGTEAIPDEWGKRLLSFEANDIPVTSLYKYDEERWGTEPIRFVSFANDAEHELGETPIPNGMVRIYGRADDENHLTYTGGSEIKYVPVGEEIELNLGPARLVKVEPILMNTATANYVFDSNDNVAGWDEVQTWKVEITNARTLPVDIEVTRGFETPYWELHVNEGEVDFEKHDVTHARFERTVAARRTVVFTYTVTTYHGAREAVFIRKQQDQPR